MNGKLTLRLDREILDKARQYAKSRRISLSTLVENYFRDLLRQVEPPAPRITPLVRELSGIIELPEDFDPKDAYIEYLIKRVCNIS